MVDSGVVDPTTIESRTTTGLWNESESLRREVRRLTSLKGGAVKAGPLRC